MPPPVVPDFVPRIDYRFYCSGKGFDRVPRHVPARLDAIFFEQREQARRAHARPELPARNRCRRRGTARNKTRDSVEIERETNNVLGQGVLAKKCTDYSSALACDFQARDSPIRYHSFLLPTA